MASIDHDLCYLTATEAIDQFKAKKLSPVELMNALLARCETVNPKLNVVTYTFAERALEQAKAAEACYMKDDARPLEGIPVAIKDSSRKGRDHYLRVAGI
jgi:amidase